MTVPKSETEEKLEKDPQEWVSDSIDLDLIYDEEDIEALKDKDKWNDKELTFTGLVNSKKDFDSIDFVQEKSDTILNKCYKYFKKIKKSRVYYGLKLDAVKHKFTVHDVNTKYKDVNKSAQDRIKNLDDITWKCAAAISRLRTLENDKPETDIKRINTLIALFHSELCASATLDISWGHANGFINVLLKNKRKNKFDFIGYELFDLIARHNIARGFNHQMLPQEATQKIDKFVDYNLNSSNIKENLKAEYIDEQCLYRVLIFPMTLTLSQALSDLRRYSEARYYLQKGLKVTETEIKKANCARSNLKGLLYWKKLFKLSLAINNRDRKNIRPAAELDCPQSRPRAENTRNSAKTSFVINYKDLAIIEDWKKEHLSEIEKWREAEISVLRWHSAEERPFGRHLETMSQSILLIIDSLDILKGDNNDEYKTKVKDCIREVLAVARSWINKLDGLAYLTKKDKFCDLSDKVKNRDFTALWTQGEFLLRVLLKYKSKFDDPSFRKWKSILEAFIELPDLKPFHSIALEFEAKKRSEKILISKDWCPRCRNKKCDILCPVDKLLKSKSDESNDSFASRDYYYKIMLAQQKRFLDYLKYRTGLERSYQLGEPPRPSPYFEIICLRRWNSFSPNLGSRASATVGGGYFIRVWDAKKGRYIGIVIDPGYNFLENLFNEGFTIADVDLVVMTHAHPDHIENFTNLLTLLRERSKRIADETDLNTLTSPMDHQILLALTEGVLERLQRNIDDEKEFIRDIVVLTADHNTNNLNDEDRIKNSRGSEAGKLELILKIEDDNTCHMDICLKNSKTEKVVGLQAARAWHNDFTDYDAIGVVIEYYNREEEGKKIGIIGDSRYTDDLHKDYENCDVIITHIGSIVDEKMYQDPSNTRSDNHDAELNKNLLELLAKKNHLYLPGLAQLICDLQKPTKPEFPLMILSEFGEELRGGLRKDIAKGLSHFGKNGIEEPLPIIPGDVGLRVDIDNKKVFCCICHRYVEPKKISSETVLPDEESMAYVCDDCTALRAGELNTLLEEWCRTARPVVPLKSQEK